MKNSKTLIAMVGIALVIAIGAMAGRTANAATPTVGLGTAASFSILAGTPSVTNTGATTINRSVGIHPAASVTGFPPGVVGGMINAGDAVALQAKSDLVVAYLDAANRPATATRVALGGLTLVDGVYNSGSAVLDLTGTLTLDGQGDPSSVWIFQATSSLVTASSSSVSLINGASPCNVFWQVTSSATLGSGSTLVGTILAQTSITLASGVTVDGRALARNGGVTLINDTFISSACSAPTVSASTLPPCAFMANLPNAPCAGTRVTAAEQSSATPTPSTPTVAPSAAPIATAAPTAGPPAAVAVAGVQALPAGVQALPAGVLSLPATSTDGPSSPLLLLGIALMAIGILVIRRQLRHS